jgi:hypothetical protein
MCLVINGYRVEGTSYKLAPAEAAVTNNPEKLGGIFDIFGVIESTFHTKSQILAAINNAKVGYPSRFKLFKQIRIIGKDGTTYIDF